MQIHSLSPSFEYYVTIFCFGWHSPLDLGEVRCPAAAGIRPTHRKHRVTNSISLSHIGHHHHVLAAEISNPNPYLVMVIMLNDLTVWW